MKRISVVCLILVLLCTGCGLFPKEESMRKAPVSKTALETQYFTVATVERGDVSNGYTAVCTYGTQQTENLSFNLPYESLVGVYVKTGDPVYEGQLLAEISLGTLEDDIEACEKTCKQIDSDLEYYSQMLSFEKERQKLAKDWGREYNTATIDELTLKVNDLSGQKTVADLKLTETNNRMKGRRLYASFNGVATYVKELRPWEPVGMDVFVTISSTDNGFLTSADDVSMFREGDSYQVETDNEIIPCTLKSIKENTQIRGRYIMVFVPTDPDLEIEPGTTGNVNIVMEEEKNVLYIPSSALRKIGDQYAVYVVDKDGMRDIRYVEIGLSVTDMTPSEKNRTVIRSGLSEGEKVILR
ncbi:MAG: hypothetical protein IKI01_09075 [Lachnospiraceae bacterium]|nr:hypothetical protein [Lachnospiraceae bacterium]